MRPDFEGFSAEDVARALQRGAELREVHEDELSDISLIDFSSESESDSEHGDEDDGNLPWSENLSPIVIPNFSETTGLTTILGDEKNELDFLSLIFIPELYVKNEGGVGNAQK